MSVASVGASVGSGVKKPDSSSSSDKPSVSSTAVKVSSAASTSAKPTSTSTTSKPSTADKVSGNGGDSKPTKLSSGATDVAAAVAGNGGNNRSSGSSNTNSAASNPSSGVADAGKRTASGVKFDRVDSAGPNWDMLQELTAGSFDNVSPSRAQNDGLVNSDNPGSTFGSWQDFVKNVQNRSLGQPGAEGYGFNYAPGEPIAFDPMRQDTAAMERSLTATPSAAGGFGIDFGGIGTALVDNAHRNQALREANPPLAGLADAIPGLRELARSPAAYQQDATIAPAAAETPVVQQAGSDPKLAAIQKYESWQDPWGQLAASLNTAAIPDRLTPDAMATTALTDAPAGSRALAGIDAATAQPSAAELALDDKVFGGMANDSVFSTDGQVAAADGTVLQPGSSMKPGYNGGINGPAKTEEPSTWDKVVDNTGKLLSHTGLGTIVSKLFPDIWNGGGDIMKGLDNGGGSGTPIDGESMTRLINGGRDPFLGDSRGTTYDNSGTVAAVAPAATTALLDFIDLNHNGIDDRQETGAYGPNSLDKLGSRYAVFPDMPPYNPGRDDEWTYFRSHLARGGVVGYAEGGEVGPLAEADPRVMMIADAEDALHNAANGTPEPDDGPAIEKFVKAFGQDALEQLKQNVIGGMKMRPGQKQGRTVVGPGGPKDDAVPAVIDGVQPAALSAGEFVMSNDAVAGAGDGDPAVGAQRLQQLHEQLAQKAA